MNGNTELAAILLAAGAARRYGGIKQLLPVDGVPMVRLAANAILAAGAELTVVVGANAEPVGAALAGLRLSLLRNEQWAEGMGSSIACGFRALTQRAAPPGAALLCLADQPRVNTTALERLIEAHRRTPDHIVACEYGSVVGPPCLFPSAFYADLSALGGSLGARSLLQRHADVLVRVDLPEAQMDIDTPQDYRRLIRGDQRP